MGVKNRRPGREAALRILYQIEIGDTPFMDALQNVGEFGDLSKDTLFFAERLARGVEERLEFLDGKIAARLIDWTLDRLAPIDRNLMRMAVYELYHCSEIPPAVTLNEAVELAKKYSTPESGTFLNGVRVGSCNVRCTLEIPKMIVN
jgi:N utilization substance protein B